MTVAELRRKVDDLERKVRDLESEKEQRAKALIPDAPPKWVLKAARKALNKARTWRSYYDVLTAYYGLKRLSAVVVPSIPEGTIARYDANLLVNPTVETRAKTMNDQTALHEFFHHLFYSTRHTHEGEGEQELADTFAEECLRREQEP